MKLKSAEFVSAIRVAVEQLSSGVAADTYKQSIVVAALSQLNISAEYLQRLVYAAEQGDFLQSIRLLEQALLSDDVSFGVEKSESDILSIIEEFASVYGKNFSNAAAVLDAVAFGTRVNKADTASVTDADVLFDYDKTTADAAAVGDAAYAFATAKALFSAINVTDDVDGEASILDDQEMQFVKVTAEAAYVADTLLRVVAFTREYQHHASAADAVAFTYGKRGVENSASIAELFARQVNYARSFAETASASDNIDTVFVGKALADVAAATDTFQRTVSYIRQLADSTDLVDDHASTLGKYAFDAALFSESLVYTMAYARKLSDHGFLADNIDYVEFSKTLADAPAISESLIYQMGYNRAHQDVASPLDDLSTSFAKALSDTPLASDDIRFALGYSRALADNGFVGDALHTLGVAKEVSDTAAATDSIATAASYLRRLYDSATATDDVDGAASALDDQEIQFVKQRTDLAAVADVFAYVFSATRSLLDTSRLSDEQLKTVGKLLAESLALQDHATKRLLKGVSDQAAVSQKLSVGSRKTLSESGLVADATLRHLRKALSEAAAFSEQLFFSSGKSVADRPTAADSASKTTARPASDAIGVADLLELIRVIALEYTDTLQASDSSTLTVVKAVANTMSVGDVSIYVMAKAFSDTPSVFDEHYGLLGKALQDAFSSSDAAYLTYSKAPFDSARFSSAARRTFSKALADASTATDDVDGAASALDDQEIQFVKQRTDLAAVADALKIALGIVRTFAETTAASDSETLSVGKAPQEAVGLLDGTFMLTGKQLYDIPVATESASKALFRGRADSALIGDAALVIPGKGLLEPVSTVDAGTLRSQGYADFSCFAEDYVGASRLF